MLFTSFNFLLLVIITLIIYYQLRKQSYQVIVLIIASFIFYAANYPALLALLISSILINIGTSYAINKAVNKASRKFYAIFGVVANLGILSFFKYSPLIARTFFSSSSSIGEFLISIPLPIGISFYTFQGISLVVDTFKSDKIDSYKTLLPKDMKGYTTNIALFISFFPQLVAGPIVKAHEFLPQIKHKVFNEINFTTCFKQIVTGYFLKMVIANNLKDYTFWIAYPYFKLHSTTTLLTMLFGYSIQIFADFAGYSLIAIGIAGLFGYRLNDNFNFPYISLSFSEFWRRWHISLSTFLREYLYIPLGGNRKGKVRTYFNLMTTMVLGGLWHGAAWSYAVWGFYHGFLLAIERLINDKMKFRFKGWMLILKGLFIFSIVTIGWLLFKLPEFSHVIAYIETVFNNTNSTDIKIVSYIVIYSLAVIVYHLLYLYINKAKNNSLQRLEPLFYGVMLFLILTNSGSSSDFIYFQF